MNEVASRLLSPSEERGRESELVGQIGEFIKAEAFWSTDADAELTGVAKEVLQDLVAGSERRPPDEPRSAVQHSIAPPRGSAHVAEWGASSTAAVQPHAVAFPDGDRRDRLLAKSLIWKELLPGLRDRFAGAVQDYLKPPVDRRGAARFELHRFQHILQSGSKDRKLEREHLEHWKGVVRSKLEELIAIEIDISRALTEAEALSHQPSDIERDEGSRERLIGALQEMLRSIERSKSNIPDEIRVDRASMDLPRGIDRLRKRRDASSGRVDPT